jgi:hypothetical protein
VKHFTNIAVAAIVATLPLSANALGFSVLNSSSNLSGNTAGDFASEYGAKLDTGWVWTVAPNTVTPPPDSSSGLFLSPWANPASGSAALQDINSYWNVQPKGDGASPDPTKLSLGGVTSVFTMLWGSIDVENTIEFFNAGTSVGSVSGTDIATSGLGGTADNCSLDTTNSYGCVAEVSFTYSPGFDEIHFGAGSPDDPRNSFEFATVPLPAAAWLLLGVSGALVGAKRRSARKAA